MKTLSKEHIQIIDDYLIKHGVKFMDVRLELIDHLASEFEEDSKYVLLNDFLVDKHTLIKTFEKQRQKSMHLAYQRRFWQRLLMFLYKPEYMILMLMVFGLLYYTFNFIPSKINMFVVILFLAIPQVLQLVAYYRPSKMYKRVQSFQYILSAMALPSLFLYMLSAVKSWLIPENELLFFWYCFIAAIFNLAGIIEVYRIKKETQFLNLEWKQHFRSAYWQKSMLLNILLIFFALWMAGSFLILGFASYPMLKKLYPDNDPFLVFNGFLFFWILGDLFMRFFFQKLPVMSVKPLLALPIKRSKVVNYVLGKSAVSFFNFLPFFAIIPFAIMLINNGYSVAAIVVWILTLIVITLIINFLNFIIESLSAETELSFLPIMAIVGLLYGLNHFGIVSFSSLIGDGVNAISSNFALILIPIGILSVLYYLNFKGLYKKLYLDNSLKTKTSQARTTNLEWTKKFGDIAPFMQLDLKLITRSKRAKSSLWMLGLGLLYGLFFYPNPEYADMPWFFIFIGIFVTGIFLINFGQFIPAWDSGYYKLLMSQNVKYEKYLKSKFTLMVMSVIIMFVLSIPYVYFGSKILLAHFAAAIYNIGVNSHVMLYGGSFNRKKIELNQKAAFNFQGTGAVQWIIGIPLMILPMIIFGVLNYFINFEIAIAVIIGLGLIGIGFHQKIMQFITRKYQDSKYKMIDAFGQDN